MTPSQFLLCFLLYADQGGTSVEGDESPIATLYRYSETVRPWSRAEIQDLVDRGYLDGRPARNEHPDDLRVTSRFADAVPLGTQDFERFWDAYPASPPHDGTGIPKNLKRTSKETVRATFDRVIVSTSDYTELMRTLAWDKKRDAIDMEIDTYLGEIWRVHSAQRPEPVTFLPQ